MRPAWPILALLALGGCGTAPPPRISPGQAPEAPVPPLALPTEAPVVAASAGEAAAAYAARMTMLGQGMSGPNGLALDARGDLYESDYYRGTVTRVTPGGEVSTYAAGFDGPAGLAFDRAGNLLVACYENHRLDRVPPGGGRVEPFVGAGLKQPVWPAVDARGTIYLADYGSGRILIVGEDGSLRTFRELPGVNAIAIDPRDRLWVTTWGGEVRELDPAGSDRTVATGLDTACAIAWHPDYLAVGTYGEEHRSSGRLVLVDFQGGHHPIASDLGRTSSVLFDPAGTLYAANISDPALRRYARR